MKVQVIAGSAILYHGTTADRAIEILESGYFILTPATHNDTEQTISPNLFYLSTARSITSQFFRISNSDTVLELDGTAIGQRHRVKPVDYFYHAQQLDPSLKELPPADEKEDRILSTKPFLSTQYIKAVHVVYDKFYQRSAQRLKRICVKQRIPIYFYNKLSVNPKHRILVPFKPSAVTAPLPLPGGSCWKNNSKPSRLERLKFFKTKERKKEFQILLHILRGTPIDHNLYNTKVINSIVSDFSTMYRTKWMSRETDPELAELQAKVFSHMRRLGLTPATLAQYVINRLTP